MWKTLKVVIGILFGFLIGLIFALLNGGIACLEHGLLRLFLWRASSIPRRYVPFLEYAVAQTLLRKVGGGYIFIHRLLLEYFASFSEPEDEV